MTDLLPCPFCGGEDLDVHVGVFIGRRHESVTITCNYCLGSIYGSTEERAIAAWNTRAERTCSIEKLDALTITLSGFEFSDWGKCSECGLGLPTWSEYCPNCGAKVVGE